MLIMTTLLARLLFASWLGLGIDESYVVAASRTLHTGYFDHPPMVWWMAWAVNTMAGPGNHLTVRLPFIVLFALSTWLMFPAYGRSVWGMRRPVGGRRAERRASARPGSRNLGTP